MSATARPAKIVLIEDNVGDVYLVQEALRETGIEFELHRFADGDEAMRALAPRDGVAALSPDLVLVDLNLPRIEGLDVLRSLRDLSSLSRVPLAVLTSSESPREMQEASSAGAVRYIHKPTNLDDFLSSVGQSIRELLTQARATNAP